MTLKLLGRGRTTGPAADGSMPVLRQGSAGVVPALPALRRAAGGTAPLSAHGRPPGRPPDRCPGDAGVRQHTGAAV